MELYKLRTDAGFELSVYPGIAVSAERLARTHAILRERYGADCERRGPDSSYNCHGFTFAWKLGWIGPIVPDIDQLLSPFAPAPAVPAPDPAAVVEALLRARRWRLVARLSNRTIDSLNGHESISPGDVVLYRQDGSIQHSGLVLRWTDVNGRRVDVMVLSKFGSAGEFTHLLRNVPEDCGSTVEVWSDAK